MFYSLLKYLLHQFFFLALKDTITLMESRFWKIQAPPPKQSIHKANSLQNPVLEEKKSECKLNFFADKSPYLFSRWHFSIAFIFPLLSSPWLDMHTVVKSWWETSLRGVFSLQLPSPLTPKPQTLLQLPAHPFLLQTCPCPGSWVWF